MEYQKYKMAAGDLERRPMLDRDVFGRPHLKEQEEPEEEGRLEVNLFELLELVRLDITRATED